MTRLSEPTGTSGHIPVLSPMSGEQLQHFTKQVSAPPRTLFMLLLLSLLNKLPCHLPFIYLHSFIYLQNS